MKDPLTFYEEGLREITDVCVDPWFQEQLAASRAGDSLAWRRISGSCLRRVLDFAKRKWSPGCVLSVLDLAQEGNVILVQTIERFRGTTAPEFLRELDDQVEQGLTLLLARPRSPEDLSSPGEVN